MTEAARLEGIISLVGAAAAVGGFNKVGAAADKAQTDIDGFEKSGVKASKQSDALGASLVTAGTKMRDTGKTLTRNVTLPLTIAGAAMLKVGADFESQMSKVTAKAGATGDEIQMLRKQAIKLGADTAFSALEAAQGMEELAAAGMKPREVLKAMPGLLDAAAASGEGVAEVAGTVANTLAQFSLKATESTRIADVLAKGSNETQASIGSLGEALKFAGTGASQLGFDLEQTVGMTSMMVKAGIDGGQAGTALRMGLMQAAKGANASKIAIKKLGGVSPELAKIWKSAEPVPEKLAKMSTEFQKMDGTSRSVAAGLIFGTEASTGMLEVLKGGPATMEKWTASMRDSRGEAKRMGDEMRDNLKGDVEALGGSIESAFINMYEGASGPMRGLAQNATGLVNAFGAMGPAAQTGALGVGVMAAAAGPALIATGSLVRAYGTLQKTTLGAGAAARFAALALNPYALAAVVLGAAVLGVVGAVKKQRAEDEASRKNGVALAVAIGKRRDAALSLESAQSRVRSTTANLKAVEEEYGKSSSQYRAALDARRAAAKEAAGAQRDLNAAVKEAADADPEYTDGAGANGGKSKTVGETTKVTADLIKTEDKLTEAIKRRAKAQREALIQNDATPAPLTPVGEGVKQMPTTAAATLKAVKAAQADLNEERRKGITVGGDYTARADALAAAEKRAKKTLSDSAKEVEAASKQVTELSGEYAALAVELGEIPKRAKDGEAALRKMTRTPGNLRAAKDILTDMSEAERIIAFGTADINRILSMIGNVKPDGKWVRSFASDLALARAKAAAPIVIDVQYRRRVMGTGPTESLPGGKDGNPATPFAAGGRVRGPGTGTSDSVPAWLSNDEHVWTAAEVRAAGGHGQIEAWRTAALGGDLPKFAKGGKVKGSNALSQATNQAAIAASTLRSLKQAERQYTAALNGVKGKKGDALKTARENLAAKSEALVSARAADRDAKRDAAQNKRDAAAGRIDSANARVDSGNSLAMARAQGTAGLDDDIAATTGAYDTATGRVSKLRAQVDGVKGNTAAANQKRNDLQAQLNTAIETQIGLDQQRTELIKQQNQAELDRPRSMMLLLDAETDLAMAVAESTAGIEDDNAVRRVAIQNELKRQEAIRETLANDATTDAEKADLNGQLAASIRSQTSLTAAIEEATRVAQEESLAAQLDRITRERDVALESARLAEGGVRALSGPNDLGYGGGANAWQAASGAQPVNIYVQSLTGYSPEIQQVVAGAAGGGFTGGGESYRMYSGRN